MPPDPQWPRYSSLSFPPYRYVPGIHPHPRRHPNGHSYGRAEPVATSNIGEQWPRSDVYLFGVDLYNFAFWWECHEVFEAFWRAGPQTEHGRFFQGLIHVAGANLKVCMGHYRAADRMRRTALARLESLPATYMGMAVRVLESELRAYAAGTRKAPPLIRLTLPCDGRV